MARVDIMNVKIALARKAELVVPFACHRELVHLSFVADGTDAVLSRQVP